jgi:hypothetical protein
VVKGGAFETGNTRYSVFGLFFVDRVTSPLYMVEKVDIGSAKHYI